MRWKRLKMTLEVWVMYQKCKTLSKSESAFTRNAERGNFSKKIETLDKWFDKQLKMVHGRDSLLD